MLAAIDDSPLAENTIVIYTSDHGEMGGHHGIWQKQCFYESAVRVPLIMRGPGIPTARRIRTNVSLVDVMPTLLELAGIEAPPGLAGQSVLAYMDGDEDENRAVFSEYHCQGMLNAGFMLKKGDCRYNFYVGHRPELYNVGKEPEEFTDLANDSTYEPIIRDLHQELLCVVGDPEAVDRKAKENQAVGGMARAYSGRGNP